MLLTNLLLIGQRTSLHSPFTLSEQVEASMQRPSWECWLQKRHQQGARRISTTARLTKSFPAAQTLGKQTPFVIVFNLRSHLPVAMQTCFFESAKIVPAAQTQTPSPFRMRPTAHVLIGAGVGGFGGFTTGVTQAPEVF
jgi:hypothetical protein